MKLIQLIASIHIIFASFCVADGIQSIKCLGGGDGPNPLTDISALKGLGMTAFEPVGNIQEFVYWDKKGLVAYRNSEGKIYQMSLHSGKSYLTARSSWPLSLVKDDKETFLALRDRPVTLDTGLNPPQWRKWGYQNGIRHLYWHRFLGGDALFSVGASFIRPNQQRIEVYSFSRKGIKPHLCNLFSNNGEIYHLGEGHTYPYVFLYKVKMENNCTKLSYYNIQIEGDLIGKPVCRLYQSGQYSTSIPGNVKEVYQFPELMTNNQNMFVVWTSHPEKNLLWDDGDYGCRFYNLGGAEPVVLNSKQPILTVWNEKDGLSLIYPRKFEKGEPVVIHPLRDLIEGPIKREHLALSDDGRTLVVLAKVRDGSNHQGKKIIVVNLD